MSLLENFQKENKKRAVWQKGKIIPGYDPNQYRWDRFGNVIKYSHYGNRSLRFSWEIDHDIPTSLGGADIFSNWQPLEARTNARLGALARMIKK